MSESGIKAPTAERPPGDSGSLGVPTVAAGSPGDLAVCEKSDRSVHLGIDTGPLGGLPFQPRRQLLARNDMHADIFGPFSPSGRPLLAVAGHEKRNHLGRQTW